MTQPHATLVSACRHGWMPTLQRPRVLYGESTTCIVALSGTASAKHKHILPGGTEDAGDAPFCVLCSAYEVILNTLQRFHLSNGPSVPREVMTRVSTCAGTLQHPSGP